MTEELFEISEDAAACVEFIGFENASKPVPAARQDREPQLIAPTKTRRRRDSKPLKQTHPVRVWFDDRELLKLNSRAGAEGISLPEYVRVKALRDPRARSRKLMPGEDLFACADPTRVRLNRGSDRLPPQIEKRINAYYSGEISVEAESPRSQPRVGDVSRRPKIFAKVGHFLTELVGSRMPGHRTAGAGT
jgi:hypothetical protein